MDLVRIFVVIEVGFHVSAVPAPWGEKFYYFYGGAALDCGEYCAGV